MRHASQEAGAAGGNTMLTRRDFVRMLGAAAPALVLAACGAGAPAARDSNAASTPYSIFSRLPNPPPSNVM